ncbi:MAG: pentapeptide repeat-containing protein [Pikeienuella sp.]
MGALEIEQTLEQHKLWLRSDGREGKRAELSRVNLSQQDLRNVDLSRAILNYVRFDRADLTGATFCAAEMIGVQLNYAILKGADLSGAILNKANFVRTNLEGANLSKTSLLSITGRGANFDNANLDQSQAIGANLEYASFRDASLEGTKLAQSICTHTTFKDAVVDGADFSSTKFTNANLFFKSRQNAVFSNAKLRGAVIGTDNPDLFLAAQNEATTYLDPGQEKTRNANRSQKNFATAQTRFLRLIAYGLRGAVVATSLVALSILLAFIVDVYRFVANGGTEISTSFNYLIAFVILTLIGACAVGLAYFRVRTTAGIAAEATYAALDAHQENAEAGNVSSDFKKDT